VKYVLDTNIVVRLLAGEERVLAHLSDVDSSA
jgi:predicted nucleic acid-binding protein